MKKIVSLLASASIAMSLATPAFAEVGKPQDCSTLQGVAARLCRSGALTNALKTLRLRMEGKGPAAGLGMMMNNSGDNNTAFNQSKMLSVDKKAILKLRKRAIKEMERERQRTKTVNAKVKSILKPYIPGPPAASPGPKSSSSSSTSSSTSSSVSSSSSSSAMSSSSSSSSH